MTYQEQMKHPMWQKKRLEVMEDRGFKCQECGAINETLNVHHPVYRRGAMIWEYDVEDLQCLCHKCHKDAHALDENLKKALALTTTDIKLKAMGYILAANSEGESRLTYLLTFEECIGATDYMFGQQTQWAGDSPIVELLDNEVSENSGGANLDDFRQKIQEIIAKEKSI